MGQNETVAMADLAALIEGHRSVVARMALVGADDGWLLHHGEITLDADAAPQERTWFYDDVAFLECRIPAPLVAALLLSAEPQTIAGFDVRVPEGQATSATHNRYEGNREWNRVTTPWPRSEWTAPRPNFADHNHTGVLVGNADAPSFLNFDAALSTFFYQAPHHSAAGRPDLWRVVQPHREAWLLRTTITPDTMAVLVEGHQVAGTVLEPSTPAGHQSQELKDSGEFTFDLVNGLLPESLLVLRRGKELLDLRHFPAPSHGRARDTSVVWEQPGAELELLLAAGEGQHLECKQEIPEGESRKKMLKTIAAFAGQDGGTVLIEVQDDLQITVAVAESLRCAAAQAPPRPGTQPRGRRENPNGPAAGKPAGAHPSESAADARFPAAPGTPSLLPSAAPGVPLWSPHCCCSVYGVTARLGVT